MGGGVAAEGQAANNYKSRVCHLGCKGAGDGRSAKIWTTGTHNCHPGAGENRDCATHKERTTQRQARWKGNGVRHDAGRTNIRPLELNAENYGAWMFFEQTPIFFDSWIGLPVLFLEHMILQVLFQTLLFISPLPSCWILFRYLEAQEDSVSGALFGRIKFKIAGPIAVYLLLLLVMILSVDPKLLGLNLSTGIETWNIRLDQQLEDKLDPADSLKGEVSLSPGPGNVVYTSGSIVVSGEQRRIESATGLKGENIYFFPLNFTKSGQELVAFGPSAINRSLIELNVYELGNEKAELSKYYGELKMRRSWPWLFLVTLFSLPLLIIWLISKIGPLTIQFAGRFNAIPERFSHLLSSVKFKITGATAAYIVIMSAVFLFFHGLPRTLSANEAKADQECQSYSGKWYYTLGHFSSKLGEYVRDHAGSFKLDCQDDLKNMAAQGLVNALFKYRFTTREGCYSVPQAGDRSQIWKTLLAGITDKEILLVYENDAVRANARDLGLIRGALQESEMQKWYFYDFKQVGTSEHSVNRGELLLYRADSRFVRHCANLHKDVMRMIQKIRKKAS